MVKNCDVHKPSLGLNVSLSQLVEKSFQSVGAKKMMLEQRTERMPLNCMFLAPGHFKSLSALNNYLNHLSLCTFD